MTSLYNDHPIDDIPFVALDTETCGLYEARVVELAGVRFRGGVEESRFQMLVDPGEPIPAEARAVHGISDQMVRGAPKIREALMAFLSFAHGAVWMAHNAPFDVKILAAEFYRSELPIPKRYVLDSCRLSRRFNPALKSHALGNVCLHYGIRNEQAHRALGDSLAVMHAFHRMIEAQQSLSLRELISRHGAPYDFDRAIKSSGCIPRYVELERS